jgi:hypothetical protein
MPTKPIEDRVSYEAAVAYKALVCVDYAARDFLDMHPDTLRDKLPAMRRILSILNGMGHAYMPNWQRRTMRYRASTSDVGVARRVAVFITETCKDLDSLPPEKVEKCADRLRFILLLMNRIGRDGWLAWKDYDLRTTVGDSGIKDCISTNRAHNRSDDDNQHQLPLFQD